MPSFVSSKTLEHGASAGAVIVRGAMSLKQIFWSALSMASVLFAVVGTGLLLGPACRSGQNSLLPVADPRCLPAVDKFYRGTYVHLISSNSPV